MKSIYDRVKKYADARPLPVMVHGDKLATQMHFIAERIVNPRLSRVKLSLECLKLSAATAGSYSLSGNQVGIPNAAFIMHKDLLDRTSSTYLEKRWLHPEAYQRQEDTPVPEDEGDKVMIAGNQLLDPADYQIFMNPRLLSETVRKEIDWEYCLSFPGIRCMVERPHSIMVNYLDEAGSE